MLATKGPPPGVVAFWPVTASWTNAVASTGYDASSAGYLKSVVTPWMTVVADEPSMVVVLPWMMVVVEKVVLFVAVCPENPRIAATQNPPPAEHV